MTILPYTLDLDSAVLIRHTGGDANTAEGLPYVPGSSVRGACIALQPAFDAGQERLFFSGKVRFLNAYVSKGDEYSDSAMRLLPTPRSWYSDKRSDRVADFALACYRDLETDPTCTWNTVADAAPFTDPVQVNALHELGEDESVATGHPAAEARFHTRRNRRYERPVSPEMELPDLLDPGALFLYRSLPSRLRLQGFILADEHDLMEDLAQRILAQNERAVPIRLGRARTTQGATQLTFLPAHSLTFPEEEAFYHTAEKPDTKIEAGNMVAIWLLSDAIVRDACGQISVSCAALKHTLRRALRTVGVDEEDLNKSFKIVRAFFAPSTAAGFNRRWGLPLPSQPAVAMGSMLRCRFPALDADQLARLTFAGIGERRVDGFGRLAIRLLSEPNQGFSDLEDLPSLTSIAADAWDRTAPPTSELASEHHAYVNRLRRAVVRERVADQITKLAKKASRKLTRDPDQVSTTQLGRWRVQLAEARRQEPDQGAKSLIKFLNDERVRTRALGKKVGPVALELLGWFEAPAGNAPIPIWAELTSGFIPSSPSDEDTDIQQDPELAFALTLDLLDTTAHLAMRRHARNPDA